MQGIISTMLEKQKMDRINELARASKVRELDADERAEQKALRTEYIEKFRESFKAQLEQIELADAVDESTGACNAVHGKRQRGEA